MDRQDRPLATRAPLAVQNGGSGPPGLDLANQIEAIRTASTAPQATTWRRALLIWLRLYQREQVPGQKERVMDLRIPIPLPLLGLFLRRRISWNEALQIVRTTQRPPQEGSDWGLPPMMAVELLRIEEEKTNKRELLVIGID